MQILKGGFDLRPALPRYSTTWNVSAVLKYVLKMLQDLRQCALKSLLYILAILLCTTAGQKDQILFNVNIDLMMYEAVKVNIFESEFLKQSR